MDTPTVVTLPGTPEEPTYAALPTDSRSVFLGGIFILMLLTVLHAASEIMIPIVLAFVLKLVFQPLLRYSSNLRIPRTVAAALIIGALFFSVIGLATVLSGPAASWGEKIPGSLPQLQSRLNFLKKPVEKTQQILVQADDLAKGMGPKVTPVTVAGTRFSDRVLGGTQAFASGLFTTMLVLFFLLASGDTFLRRLVEILPRFSDKRQAVDISQQIEQDISSYLLTITAVNATIGVLVALVMEAYGVEDPILWGTMAFLLNYIPILGPLIATALFLLVGLLVIDNPWTAVSPAAVYFVIHILEGSCVTPMLLARRFTLNPVLVILALVFWSWMWGVPGAILAMPMLAITKIICDRIHRLSAFGHFLGG